MRQQVLEAKVRTPRGHQLGRRQGQESRHRMTSSMASLRSAGTHQVRSLKQVHKNAWVCPSADQIRLFLTVPLLLPFLLFTFFS